MNTHTLAYLASSRTYTVAGQASSAADAATERTGIKHERITIWPHRAGEPFGYTIAPVGVEELESEAA